MGEIIHLIDIYKEQGVKGILAHPELCQNIQILQMELTSLEPDEKLRTRNLLNEILKELDSHFITLSSEIHEKLNHLERISKNTEACLAYLKTTKGERR